MSRNTENYRGVNEALYTLLLYCRPGFEKECAAEIQDQTQRLEVLGYSKASPGTGFVLFTPYQESDMAVLAKQLRFADLCFARQMVAVLPLLSKLPVNDRISPLLESASTLARQFSDAWLETADTNEAKELAVFVRKFEGPLTRALADAGLTSTKPGAPRLHLFFLNSTTVYVGLSRPVNSSPWPMGIARLKFPRSAPSRSTLKLEEAFLFFLGDEPQVLATGHESRGLGCRTRRLDLAIGQAQHPRHGGGQWADGQGIDGLGHRPAFARRWLSVSPAQAGGLVGLRHGGAAVPDSRPSRALDGGRPLPPGDVQP